MLLLQREFQLIYIITWTFPQKGNLDNRTKYIHIYMISIYSFMVWLWAGLHIYLSIIVFFLSYPEDYIPNSIMINSFNSTYQLNQHEHLLIWLHRSLHLYHLRQHLSYLLATILFYILQVWPTKNGQYNMIEYKRISNYFSIISLVRC